MNTEPAAPIAPRPTPPPHPSPLPASKLGRLASEALAASQSLWKLDREWPATALQGKASRWRSTQVRWLRHTVQLLFACLVLAIGVEFVRWVRGLEAGQLVGQRPPGVEGFLPLSGLMSLRHLWHSGEIHSVHPAALVLLLLFVGMSLAVKKSFCSWVCPVGGVSEMLAALSKRLFRRRIALPRWLDLPLRSLKYLLLAFFVWAIFVRMSAPLIASFLDSPYNRVADVKMLYFFERLSPLAGKVLLGLVAVSVVIPYAWCRYLCPYGALLGITSLLAPGKIVRHAPSCIDCGRCAKACPARLPVDQLSRVRSDECVGCLSCVADCPVPRALRVETPGWWGRLARPLRPAVAAALLVGLFLGGVAAARLSGHWRSSVPDAEVMQRIHSLDGPEYDHLR